MNKIKDINQLKKMILKEINDIDNLLTKLIRNYDLFFRGYERIEPQKERKHLKNRLNKLMNFRLNDGVLNQKLLNLTNKFSTYQRKWDSIWLQIEKGTYKIDRYKMKMHNKNKNDNKDEYEKVIGAYIKLQNSLGMNKNFDIKALASKLKKQEKLIKERYNCKKIEFKVAMKEGKATIKPILIKG